MTNSKSENQKSANINQSAVTGIVGDVTVGNISQTINHYVGKSEIDFFQRTGLEDFKPPNFPKITSLSKIINHLNENHILVLGDNHADKLDLAWYFAAHIHFSIPGSTVLGWERTSDTKGVIAAIRKEISNAASKDQENLRIFVLLNLSPQDLGTQDADLESLKRFVDEHKFFVIATTEIPQSKWNLSKLEENLWCDSSALLYEPESLGQSALTRIPQSVDISSDIRLAVAKLVQEQLRTVSDINTFIDWLRVCKETISLDVLYTAIHNAKEDKKERLKKWFRALTPREQLLALGITLFNNLYKDQFFAALERVVRRVWQQRDPSLRALDHCDLENLGNYYEFLDVIKDDDFVLHRLNIKDPEAGKLLLGIAWESHRRQIMTALEEIVRIIQDSAQGQFSELSDWQIYGESVLQNRLYEGTSEPFANVGLIAAEATAPVRGLLEALASDGQLATQDFVAKVLAYWYKTDTGKLTRTLQSFYEVTNDKPSYQQDLRLIARQDSIRSTVALAVSYAALNDLPNQLSSILCDWFKRLSTSKNSWVRVYFGHHTLVYVVPRHLLQLHSTIKEIAEKQSDLSSEVAHSLALAYRNYPDDVLEFLQEWKKADKTYTLLCTVIRTYGLIDCHLYPDKLTPQFACEQIKSFWKVGTHPLVREAVIAGMSDRLSQDCSFNDGLSDECLNLSSVLLGLVPTFSKTERNQFVRQLTTIYLAQRENLEGGERLHEINGMRYQIWINQARPLTAVERMMLLWLGQSQNRTAQQIATQAAIEFAKALDLDEDTELNRLRNLQSPLMDENGIFQRDNSRPWHDNWLAPTAAWLATLQEKIYYPVVQNILPEALIHHTAYKSGMEFVLRKWEKSQRLVIGNDKQLELRPAATSLRRGLWVVDHKGPLMAAGAGVLILGLMTINTVSSQIAKLPTPNPSPLNKPTESPKAIDSGISLVDATGIRDVDSPTFDGGELKVSFENGTPDDLLSVLTTGADTGQINVKGNQVLYGSTVIGTLTAGKGDKPLSVAFNSNATPEAVEALLRNVAYKNSSNPLTPGFRTVQFVLSDGSGGISKPLIRKVSLIDKNQAPVIAIALPESLSAKEGSGFNYGKISISDPDSQTVIVQLKVENGTLSVKGDLPKGIKTEAISGNTSKVVELKGPLATINTTLSNPSAIAYTPNSNFAGDDLLKITVMDDGPTQLEQGVSLVWPPDVRQPQQTSKDIKIAVIPRNQFPLITLPDSQEVEEDQDIGISSIVIKDPDSQDDKAVVTVTLSVDNGSLKVKSTVASGVKTDNISGNASSSVTLKGTIATINTTLADPAAITYRGKQDYSGPDTLKVKVDDGGRGAEKGLTINVKPVNDAPQFKVLRPGEQPTPLPSPTQTSTFQPRITQEEALDVIRGYLRAKREIFAPPFSREAAARYTTGTLYNDIVQPGKAIDALSQKNQAYQYGNQQLEFLGGFVVSDNRAVLNVLITEQVTLYENGSVKSPPRSNPKSYQFDLRFDNGTWKIFDYKDLNE